jgi:DNA-binding NarL/FixJ family response regulator
LLAKGGKRVIAENIFVPLSDREAEVLRLICAGHSNAGIAEALTLSMGTVKTHVRNIFNKTGAGSRLELAAMRIMELEQFCKISS